MMLCNIYPEPKSQKLGFSVTLPKEVVGRLKRIGHIQNNNKNEDYIVFTNHAWVGVRLMSDNGWIEISSHYYMGKLYVREFNSQYNSTDYELSVDEILKKYKNSNISDFSNELRMQERISEKNYELQKYKQENEELRKFKCAHMI